MNAAMRRWIDADGLVSYILPLRPSLWLLYWHAMLTKLNPNQ